MWWGDIKKCGVEKVNVSLSFVNRKIEFKIKKIILKLLKGE